MIFHLSRRSLAALGVHHLRRRMSTHYHAVVIGSGQGGGPLAQAFAKAGHRTAVVESTHVGGTCVNEGCTPTKTMVASARLAYEAVRAPDYGVQFKRNTLVLNVETVRKRKRDIVTSFRTGGENRLKGTEGLELLMGKAKFISPTELEVTMNEDGEVRKLTADKFFVNAGCYPTPLKCKNADKVKYLNSTTIMELDSVPKHLMVIGGGYVGIEFAQMFKRFGSKVSIIQRGPRLLPREDPDVSQEVHKILSDAKIDIYLNAEPTELSNATLDQIVVALKLKDGGDKSLVGKHLLSAAGRTPNTASLNVEAAGIEVDSHGFIKVDPELKTTAGNIWALGDIKGGPQFTHISYDVSFDPSMTISQLLNSSSLATVPQQTLSHDLQRTSASFVQTTWLHHLPHHQLQQPTE